ncbi:MAG: VCBS repeat-containing protein [Candidatus Bipolaricaulota bacterium]|nr:VCBS repeat-containing protein [Candidatus Bipolaricaulota bacterium]
MKGWTWLLLVPLLVAGAFYGHDLLLGLHHPYGRGSPNPKWPALGTPWAMWPVDNPGDWLPNGLDSADVNGDGFPDLLVNYEFRGRIRVVLHPGRSLAHDRFWPAVDVGFFPNAESAALGDLDGDGALDVVVAQGIEHHRGPSALRILWGEAGALRWHDGGPLPASVGLGQYLYVRVADLDGDRFPDVVVGGRAARPAGGKRTPEALAGLPRTGIRLFRNPRALGGDPRDPRAWAPLPIDPEVPSGHGFVLADLDRDGLLDLVVNTADWDTPDAEEAVLVYRNPGPSALDRPWPALALYRSPEFYGKEQVAVADLDGDGRLDVVAQAEAAVHLFWNRSRGKELEFQHERIGKPPALRWRSRPLAVADLNGDGLLDIVGASIHRDGLLPRDVAALWWLEQTAEGWAPRVIKWGSGFLGLGTFNGEKWDQLMVLDVDGDGDLDLVANVEEMNRLRSLLAVVWFENPSVRPAALPRGRNGLS